MTRFDLHPEDLLERFARGDASAADLARLEQHLAECEVCRVERALSAQAALDTAPLREEKLIVARLKRDVAARLASPSGRRTRRKRLSLALVLVAASVASAAAAATIVLVRAAAPRAVEVAAPRVARASHDAQAPRGLPSAVALERPSAEPPFEHAAEPAPKPPGLEPLSSAELFSRANQARREGKAKEAARLYRILQERFSGTSEELVSRVTLGRLLLDRLGDSRGALVQFNSYLASPGGGALREEAMVGRALALGRMGRAAEERAAWKALLDAWPKSTQAKRAQARLVELGAGDAARPPTDNGVGARTR